MKNTVDLSNIKLRRCPFCNSYGMIDAAGYETYTGYYYFSLGCHNPKCVGPAIQLKLGGPDYNLSNKYGLDTINRWNRDSKFLYPAKYILHDYPASREFESVVDGFDGWIGKIITHNGKVYIEVED